MTTQPSRTETPAEPQALSAECEHPVLERYRVATAGGSGPTLWACRDCKRRFYPACPTCVDVGHRNVVHPAASRESVGADELLTDEGPADAVVRRLYDNGHIAACDRENALATVRGALASSRESVGAGLDELRALSDAATPGPWTERPNHKPYHIVVFGGRKAYEAGLTTSDIEAADARLIIAAVNFVRDHLNAAHSETKREAAMSMLADMRGEYEG